MDEAVLAVEQAMVRIRRGQKRRALAGLLGGEAGAVDVGVLGVVDAVEEGGPSVTVGLVAQRLGLDPSRASRLVARAVGAGAVARVAAQGDGRRVQLELTPAGRALAEDSHRRRRALFAAVMADWTETDRARFARLLTRFTQDLGRVAASS